MTVASTGTRQVAGDVVCLLGNPTVMQGGRRYAVPEGCKRVLAFVALQHGRVDRRHAAGSLWPDGSEGRAAGNLRSALWRLRGAGITVLESDKASIYLREHTTTDLDELCGWADRLIDGTAVEADLRVPDWTSTVAELLPGWYDEWVIFERERIRQRMLHALEVLSCTLRRVGRYGEAIDAAMDAVAVEPLRESAHRVLAEAHVAEGNIVEARRTFLRYRDLVRRELGVEPSTAFRAWLQNCAARPARSA
ncbi:AfsR/SARP family transcriptional regulator [Demequina mangrovi]|uniref:DNA-binding transcriptional activator of the SARP family n=1 Tax=Demequina mangrovi TaxID=1043493 RepID=A0A1H6TSU1_9MICO|nr:BTAD domain-containing putative transcriptional regulator [Demequina mangrovi]SEI83139.1 DNA-binding transcriptional activator of the SARP family [Demequina mangrovi]